MKKDKLVQVVTNVIKTAALEKAANFLHEQAIDELLAALKKADEEEKAKDK